LRRSIPQEGDMAQIQGSFCYNGKEFGIVEEDTIVQLGGNQIVLWNTGN